MASSKKLKEEAKALNIPYYWNYGEKKLKELVAGAKPEAVAKSCPRPSGQNLSLQQKTVDNKKEILKHLTACQALITAEKKVLVGSKAQYHAFMLDRAAYDLKNASIYLNKIS